MNRSRRGFIAIVLAAAAIGAPLSWSAASASEDPIPGVDVVVEKVPPGSLVGRMRSDRQGQLQFRSLSTGTYVVRDRFGNKATVKHQGGPATWRLIGLKERGKPVWTLVDESDPL